MEEFLELLPIIGAIVLFILVMICVFTESRVTGKYAYYGVYGRARAFFFMDLFLAGVFALVGSFIPSVREAEGLGFWGMFGVGAVLTAIGLFIYFVTWANCPYELRRGLMISMIMSGVGVTVKLTFFFIGVIWTLTAPREMVDSRGNTVYVDSSGDVYSASGEQVGKMTGNNTYNRYKDY